ncbi:MAG: hypothetical protein HW387_921 [Parachlamydiales bacterium]|nr:hypothetical protein [Parachlamydiales bacterium]
MAFQYASEALKNNREIVLVAVQQNGMALQYASEALKNNREIVLVAVQQNGRALQYASEALKDNREIVLVAVQQNGAALQYASEALRHDQTFSLATNGYDRPFRSQAWPSLLGDEYSFFADRRTQARPSLLTTGNLFFADRRAQTLSSLLTNEYPFSVNTRLQTRPPLTPDEILASPNSLIITSNRLEIHHLVFETKPEEVLNRLARRSNDESLIPQVVFLQDNLTPDDGVDAGGLSAQLITELFAHLFDGSENRKIRLVNEIPSLIEPVQENEKQLLNNLGIMIGRLFKIDGLIAGRILPDRYFELIQSTLIFTDNLDYSQMYGLCQHLVHPEMMRLHNISETRAAISSTDRDWLINQLAFDDKPNAELKKDIEQHLVELYRSMILAAREMAQGITIAIGDLKPLRRLSYTKLSEKIQGQAFSREAIAQQITYEGHSEVVRQKVTWLKAHITSPDTPQKWVENFLFAITGQRSLTPKTKIKVKDSSDNMCKAHTCFQQLEVPTTHTNIGSRDVAQCPDQQKFLKNLQILMDNGSGYQIT